MSKTISANVQRTEARQTSGEFTSLLHKDSKKLTQLNSQNRYSKAPPKNALAAKATPRMAGAMWIRDPKLSK